MPVSSKMADSDFEYFAQFSELKKLSLEEDDAARADAEHVPRPVGTAWSNLTC
jgi:hypothetical protein